MAPPITSRLTDLPPSPHGIRPCCLDRGIIVIIIMPSSIGHRSWGQQQQQQQQQSVIQKWALVRPYTLQDLLMGQRDLISPTWWLSLPAHCCCWPGCWSWVHHSIYWRSVPARSGSCNVFKGLFNSAIPLLKGPMLRANVHLTGDVLRGKTMKQPSRTASPSW